VPEHDPIEIDASALMEEFFPTQEPQTLKIEVADASDKLIDTLVSSLSALTERLVQTEERQGEVIAALLALSEQMSDDRQNLTAALAQDPPEPPVINVTVPEPIVNVTVPEPVVTVNVPETVVHVAPPEVNITLPSTSRKVTVKRDPLTGMIASADVEEVDDGR